MAGEDADEAGLGMGEDGGDGVGAYVDGGVDGRRVDRHVVGIDSGRSCVPRRDSMSYRMKCFWPSIAVGEDG